MKFFMELIEMEENHKTPILIYTDLGTDVDDALAITYVQGSQALDLVGIVTTHMIPDRRAMIAKAMMDSFGQSKVPISAGSIFSLGREHKELHDYLLRTLLEDIPVQGQGIIDTFPQGVDLILEMIERHGKNLVISGQAPLTDLAKAINRDERTFARLGALYIQGHTDVIGEKLKPNPEGYNLREDMQAAEIVFEMQDRIPMTIVGKFPAYVVRLGRQDFAQLESTGHRVGRYLKIHAEKSLASYSKTEETFRRVFQVPPDVSVEEALSKMENISNPYDALVAMAIARPDLFEAQQVGQHRLIGMTAATHGIKNPEEAKKHLMETMLYALRRN